MAFKSAGNTRLAASLLGGALLVALATASPTSAKVDKGAVAKVRIDPPSAPVRVARRGGASASSARQCWRGNSSKYTAENVFGWDLFSYSVTKTWCENGNRVISPKADANPHVTTFGSGIGWGYDGTRKSGGFIAWRGNPRGAHQSTLRGNFTRTCGVYSCGQKLPAYRITAFARNIYSYEYLGD
jgi:hypothetical protein